MGETLFRQTFILEHTFFLRLYRTTLRVNRAHKYTSNDTPWFVWSNEALGKMSQRKKRSTYEKRREMYLIIFYSSIDFVVYDDDF